MEWSKECSRASQIALGLENTRLQCERARVVRCDVENLIKFSQCFGEATLKHVEEGVLGEHRSVTRVTTRSASSK
jgi:hypothetical protein